MVNVLFCDMVWLSIHCSLTPSIAFVLQNSLNILMMLFCQSLLTISLLIYNCLPVLHSCLLLKFWILPTSYQVFAYHSNVLYFKFYFQFSVYHSLSFLVMCKVLFHECCCHDFQQVKLGPRTFREGFPQTAVLSCLVKFLQFSLR